MAVPEKSDVRMLQGQRYVCVGLEPYVTKAGDKTTLAVWESHCATCGAPFRFAVSVRKDRFVANRRCSEHKRPGVKVRKRRKTK